MKMLSKYDELGLSSADDVFEHLVSSLKQSNTTWDYFVNWAKICNGVDSVAVELNILNYLVGKNNFDDEVKMLLGKHPSVVKVIPILLACRESSFEVLTDFSKGKLNFESFTFAERNTLSDYEIDQTITFMKSSGLSRLFTDNKIKNVVDYVTGIEVGLDSNGRKNRSGTTMESIMEAFICKLCQKNGYGYLKEATARKIRQEFGVDVPEDKSSRRYDFVVHNGEALYLIETNFYGGAGSKLKATAGEYRTLHDFLGQGKCTFVWVTDGLGWKKTTKQLREAFDHINFVLNLDLVEKGVLEYIIKEGH